MIFYYHANETHFHKKGFAPGLVLRVSVFGTRKWPIWRVAVDKKSFAVGPPQLRRPRRTLGKSSRYEMAENGFDLFPRAGI